MAPSDPRGFQPIPNPYIVGNPIESKEMFFGREDDFDFIRRRVVSAEEGGLLVLCGARRSGKTSILFQIKGGRLGPEFIPILIDMQSMTVQDDAEFLAKVAQEVIRAIDHPEISFKADYLGPAARNPFNAFQTLIQIIGTKLPDRKLVLMFDEYELIETHLAKGRFTTDILNLLASWMEQQRGVFFVFTGSDRLEARDKRVWSNFLGKALHRRISFLSRDDTERLIHEPVQGVVHYDACVPDQLFHLTAGQPFYTQVLCQALVDDLNEQRKDHVTEDDVHRVVTEMIENPLPQMIFSWSSLEDVEKLCLSCLAELNKDESRPRTFQDILDYPVKQKTGWRFDAKKLHETTERLFHQDLLNKTPRGDTLFFRMDLWRLWIGRMHSIWQVVDEITERGRRPGPGIRRDQPRPVAPWLIPTGIVAVLAAYFGFQIANRPPAQKPEAPASVVLASAPVDSGWLMVESDPPGATVYLDQRRLGPSPRLELQPAGRHLVELELAGHHGWRDSTTVAAGETTLVGALLPELTGTLVVLSTPPGASVELDGARTGRVTPVTFDQLGVRKRYRVAVALNGYHGDSRGNLEIAAGGADTVRFALTRVTYTVTVRSDPDSAFVIWGGNERGVTPLVLDGVPGGDHDFEIRRRDFITHKAHLTVDRAGMTYSASLDPLPPATLFIQVAPYSDIFIDGILEVEGRSNFTASLPQGPHTVLLRFPDHPPHEQTILLQSGRTDTLKFNFQAEGGRND